MEDAPLVSAKYLLEHDDDPHIKIFDIRGVWGDHPHALHENYVLGHIPKAIYLDWTKELITTTTAIEDAPVPDISLAQLSFKTLGISADDTVILYDDDDHMFSSRVCWVMRYFGHPGVKVLDGGWNNWQANRYPVSTKKEIPGIGNYKPQEQPHLRVNVDDVLLRSGHSVLVDGRSVEGYCGLKNDPRSGHIPGAINMPFRSLLDEQSGLFKDNLSIAQQFTDAGINLENATIISSCGSGYAGSVVLLALKKIGIYAALYDGSFSEWKKDPERPVEQALN